MSGTSLDGLDGVVVRWPDERLGAPTTPSLSVLARHHIPFTAAQRTELLSLNAPGPDELHRAALAANHLSQQAADTVDTLLLSAGLHREDVAAIGFHGQTVRHRPGEFDGVGYTLQLHNASLLAERCGIDVVCDFRSRDVSAGGQGAPLVPAFHAGLWSRPGEDVAVLNLGGIANLTLMAASGEVRGFDCGPANVLMDLWIQRHRGQAYDADGAWSSRGQVQGDLLADFQSEPFFSRPLPKSTGRDLFNAEWLAAHGVDRYRAEDVQATLCELTAWAVEHHMAREMPSARSLWVCGGGARNAHLLNRLRERLKEALGRPVLVEPTDAHGLDAMDVEAAAFAWLAWQFLRQRPGNRPEVTGARGPRILGALYPGRRDGA